jgi:hypothetical protein
MNTNPVPASHEIYSICITNVNVVCGTINHRINGENKAFHGTSHIPFIGTGRNRLKHSF